MIDLKRSTLAELRSEFRRLASVVASAEGERKAIHQEMTSRQGLVAAKARIATLSAPEREALRAALK